MRDLLRTLSRAEIAVGVFTLAYMLAFTAWFVVAGNREFIVYVVTMVLLLWLVTRNLRRAAFRPGLLWALSVWGLMHMAGGSVPVGDSVLYSWVIWPLTGVGDSAILKYDQVVHAYGFGVTAWVLWHLLDRHFPALRGTATIHVYPVLGSMGLGALNEMVEFMAVLMVSETNVGGYYNTALDLVFNATGAVIAMLVVAWSGRSAGLRGTDHGSGT